MLLACGRVAEGMAVLARRPVADRAAVTAEPCGTCDGLRPLDLRPIPSEDGGEVEVLPLPGLPPGRYPLMADVPKLMRRVKGVLGAVLALPDAMSSSSMALSSIESELVDMLSRRMPKAAGLVGEVPDKPIVLTDSRRL